MAKIIVRNIVSIFQVFKIQNPNQRHIRTLRSSTLEKRSDELIQIAFVGLIVLTLAVLELHVCDADETKVVDPRVEPDFDEEARIAFVQVNGHTGCGPAVRVVVALLPDAVIPDILLYEIYVFNAITAQNIFYGKARIATSISRKVWCDETSAGRVRTRQV